MTSYRKAREEGARMVNDFTMVLLAAVVFGLFWGFKKLCEKA